MYHTQEKRGSRLIAPITCTKDNAWLGVAWYFWYDEQDAVFWGNVSKKATRYYEVYKGDIDCQNVLDTVFNEEHYLFWIKQIDKVQVRFAKLGKELTLKALNQFFKEEGKWTKFDGIMFQDISENQKNYILGQFQYKKRIQLAVYNYNIITNFALAFEGQCV